MEEVTELLCGGCGDGRCTGLSDFKRRFLEKHFIEPLARQVEWQAIDYLGPPMPGLKTWCSVSSDGRVLINSTHQHPIFEIKEMKTLVTFKLEVPPNTRSIWPRRVYPFDLALAYLSHNEEFVTVNARFSHYSQHVEWLSRCINNDRGIKSYKRPADVIRSAYHHNIIPPLQKGSENTGLFTYTEILASVHRRCVKRDETFACDIVQDIEWNVYNEDELKLMLGCSPECRSLADVLLFRDSDEWAPVGLSWIKEYARMKKRGGYVAWSDTGAWDVLPPNEECAITKEERKLRKQYKTTIVTESPRGSLYSLAESKKLSFTRSLNPSDDPQNFYGSTCLIRCDNDDGGHVYYYHYIYLICDGTSERFKKCRILRSDSLEGLWSSLCGDEMRIDIIRGHLGIGRRRLDSIYGEDINKLNICHG